MGLLCVAVEFGVLLFFLRGPFVSVSVPGLGFNPVLRVNLTSCFYQGSQCIRLPFGSEAVMMGVDGVVCASLDVVIEQERGRSVFPVALLVQGAICLIQYTHRQEDELDFWAIY